jgi:uncharacterized membrane protein
MGEVNQQDNHKPKINTTNTKEADMEAKDLGKSSLGMDANLAACLSYVMGFITGIIFYILEKENRFVKFHAMQSIVVFGLVFVLNIILPFIPIIGWILLPIVWVVSFVLWIILMIKAYQGERLKLPVVGDIAEKNS